MSLAQRIPNPTSPTTATWHNGRSREFLVKHNAEVREAIKEGGAALQKLHDGLLDRIADERNLKIAWNHLARYGGQAAGPNGHCFGDYSNHEVWSLMRCISESILNDLYRAGPFRKYRVPKTCGIGYRTLSIPNIEDRVVARGVVQVIQPLLDPFFETTSSGYRPGVSRIDALADALRLTAEGGTIWGSNDCQDAFDRVPNNRLKDVVRLKLPDDVCELICRIIPTDSRRGIPQGSPLSPLLLNMYLDHLVDKPWRTRHPDIPLLRHADDLLLCCRDHGTATEAYADLNRMLTSTGMRIKSVASSGIDVCSCDTTTTWLGYTVSFPENSPKITIADDSWQALAQHLILAHYKPYSSLIADAVVTGWLDQLGPCFEHEDRENVCQRITAIARQSSFEEVPAARSLVDVWRRSRDRWRTRLQRSGSSENQSQPEVHAANNVVGGVPF